ncbi:MAG: hypothetical protein ACW985_07260 [Candidatus Thorarchaeota archaeon]|jgi:hypothetical protein
MFLLVTCAFLLVLSTAVSSGQAAELKESESSVFAPSKPSTPMTLSDNLPAPQLSLPADGEIFGLNRIDAEAVLFEWQPVEEAEGYELMLMTPSRTVPIYIQVAGTSFQIWLNSASGIPGETDGDYSWAVRTLDEDDQGEDDLGEFSATWTFRIDTLHDGQPSLIAPLNGESYDQGTVLLEWQVPSDISGTQFTVIQVYNSSLLAPENFIREDYVFAPALNMTLNDLEEGTYFWRCQAFDIVGNPSDWSAVWNFTIEFYESILPPTSPTTTPPVTNLNIGTHYVDESGTVYVTSMTEFNLIASSESASDITTSYCIDDGPWLEFSEPFYLSGQDGVRNVSFYSSDEFGNAEELQRIQVVLTGLNLESSISKSRFWDDRVRFNIVLENNFPLEICELELGLDIPEEFRIRHLFVWFRDAGSWPRPAFLFLDFCFGWQKTYNFLDEMEITLEDNMLSIPWLPAAGKLYIFINLEYAPEGEDAGSEESDLPSEYTFEVIAVATATSPFDDEQGLIDACSTLETIEMPADDDFEFHWQG